MDVQIYCSLGVEKCYEEVPSLLHALQEFMEENAYLLESKGNEEGFIQISLHKKKKR